jgi:hypothetical protein
MSCVSHPPFLDHSNYTRRTDEQAIRPWCFTPVSLKEVPERRPGTQKSARAPPRTTLARLETWYYTTLIQLCYIRFSCLLSDCTSGQQGVEQCTFSYNIVD